MQKCFEAISRSSSRHASRTAVWLWLSEVEKLGPVQPLLKGKIMFRNGRWFSCKSWKQPADPDDVLKTADDNGYNVPFALVVLELPLHQRFCHWILQQKGLYIHAGFWYSTTKWKLCYGGPSQGVARECKNKRGMRRHFLHSVCPSFSQQMADTCENACQRQDQNLLTHINPQESWLKYVEVYSCNLMHLEVGCPSLAWLFLARDEFSFLTNNDLVSFSCFCVFSAAGFFGFFWNIGVLKVFVKVISDVCLLATS